MNRFLMILLLALPLLATAEETPERGMDDPRVRIVKYNPLQVVKLSTFFGVSTHVQFGETETIRDVAVGDELAWEVKPRGRNLYIKPRAAQGDTNLTIVTDRRTYQFALTLEPRSRQDGSAWRDPNLVYSLYFKYPEEEAARKAAAERADVLKGRLSDTKARLKEAKREGQNYDYWQAGSPEVSPTAARDDGRFTYLAFSHNRDMPAVYSVDEKGNEALINTNVEGNTIVIHRVFRRLSLRKGDAVVCLVNRSYDLDGGTDNATGTVARDVERVMLKGAE
jgi:type IV secretion system protein VirB9